MDVKFFFLRRALPRLRLHLLYAISCFLTSVPPFSKSQPAAPRTAAYTLARRSDRDKYVLLPFSKSQVASPPLCIHSLAWLGLALPACLNDFAVF